MSVPRARPTAADVEAARRLYDEAETSASIHWFACRARRDGRWCRACDELDSAADAALTLYQTTAHLEAGLEGIG